MSYKIERFSQEFGHQFDQRPDDFLDEQDVTQLIPGEDLELLENGTEFSNMSFESDINQQFPVLCTKDDFSSQPQSPDSNLNIRSQKSASSSFYSHNFPSKQEENVSTSLNSGTTSIFSPQISQITNNQSIFTQLSSSNLQLPDIDEFPTNIFNIPCSQTSLNSADSHITNIVQTQFPSHNPSIQNSLPSRSIDLDNLFADVPVDWTIEPKFEKPKRQNHKIEMRGRTFKSYVPKFYSEQGKEFLEELNKRYGNPKHKYLVSIVKEMQSLHIPNFPVVDRGSIRTKTCLLTRYAPFKEEIFHFLDGCR